MRADPSTTTSINSLLSLWLHECCRVFEDRLINGEDREWFRKLLNNILAKNFDFSWDEVSEASYTLMELSHMKIKSWAQDATINQVITQPRLIYCDYLVPGADPKVYQPVEELSTLSKVVQEYLDDYNSISTAPMKLVMFLDAMEHVSRITRVIKLPLGKLCLNKGSESEEPSSVLYWMHTLIIGFSLCLFVGLFCQEMPYYLG